MKYSYSDIRIWLLHFRTLDYTKTKHRKEDNTFIYRIVLYDYKMKVLFHLKGGQKEELLLNLIFPGTDENGDDEKNTKEKEADISTSLSWCSYTPRLVTPRAIHSEF